MNLSNKQAEADGVGDRAKFIEQDMFKADIGKATVVTLYVLPDFMEKLRPKLMAELKPGARIVAHDYYMSEWYPDRQAQPHRAGKKARPTAPTRHIFIYGSFPPWSPATGAWSSIWAAANDGMVVLTFNQQYQRLTSACGGLAGSVR